MSEWTQVNSKKHLQDKQDQEVSVGDPLELLKQVERKKGDEVVFGGLDGIRLHKEKKKRSRIINA